MNIAVQKTLSLIFLIIIGLLLKHRLVKSEHHQAMKVLILNVALPAIIFIALTKLHFESNLFILPLLVLVFNGLVLLLLKITLPFFGIANESAEIRTFMLLLPSLAPGLSCFPFITEYLGEETLAKGALADIGNKIAVLFFSYMLAMHWFYKINDKVRHSNYKRFKSLVVGMLNEPINMIMMAALVLISFDINFHHLPFFLQDSLNLLSNLMTPLILIFIGVAVTFNWRQFKSIARLLVFRSGVSFCLSALLLSFMPGAAYSSLLLAVVFPQSACSFWPFAHIMVVEKMSKKEGTFNSLPIFNSSLATNVLALSLPFSTLIILTIFTGGSFFIYPLHVFGLGLGLIMLAIIPAFVNFTLKMRLQTKAKASNASTLPKKKMEVTKTEC